MQSYSTWNWNQITNDGADHGNDEEYKSSFSHSSTQEPTDLTKLFFAEKCASYDRLFPFSLVSQI